MQTLLFFIIALAALITTFICMKQGWKTRPQSDAPWKPAPLTRQQKRELKRHWMDNPYIVFPAVCIFLVCPVFWLFALVLWVGGSEVGQYTNAWNKGEDHTRFGTGRIVNLDHRAHNSRTCNNCKREVPKDVPCVWGCDDEPNTVTVPRTGVRMYVDVNHRLNP